MDLTRLGQLGKEGVLAMLADSTNVERPGHTRSERAVGASFDELFKGMQGADHCHHLCLQCGSDSADHQRGRPLRTQGGGHWPEHGEFHAGGHRTGVHGNPQGILVDINHIKSLPREKICIITTGSQGEAMSALFRIAFSTHKQVDIQAGDRVIISASAIPGNENAVNNIINELYRKKAEVVSENAGALHVSGHACQDELKIIHALVRPKFFIPVHGGAAPPPDPRPGGPGDGNPPENIIIGDVGRIIELTPHSAQLGGTVPSGRVFVDGYGVGDVGSVVLRDRRHLAQDGMIVVVVSLSGETGELVSGPDIITRGFVYVKESESLMEELREVALRPWMPARAGALGTGPPSSPP